MKPQIIFENNDFLIVDKPSGLVVHPFDHSNEYTLLDFLLKSFPFIFCIKNEIVLQDKRVINLGGIVHKLDRDTSGILVVVKTQSAFDTLKGLFQTQQIQKEYLAYVEGVLEKNSFTIDAPLGRNKKEYKQSTVPSNPRGEFRPAVTEVEVLERKIDATLVLLKPKTGRTHQLRAHMSSIGHPIIGDIAYGSVKENPRILLHAKSISFPLFDKQYSFSAETPSDFYL